MSGDEFTLWMRFPLFLQESGYRNVAIALCRVFVGAPLGRVSSSGMTMLPGSPKRGGLLQCGECTQALQHSKQQHAMQTALSVCR